MKKKTLTALALGAATVATGMASNVHADNVTVTKQQIGDETKITTTTTKEVNQQKVVQDKQAIANQQKVVNSAKSSLDRAKVNASSSSQAVPSAQSKVNSAKKTLDEAKAKQPSQIKQQVTKDQNQVTQDRSSIQSTQSSIQQDQQKVSQDKQAIANAGQKVQQDQQKLNDDQGKLSNAQNTLSNDQNKLNSVNDQIKNAQQNLNNSENNVYDNTIKNPNITLDDLQNAYNDPYKSVDSVGKVTEKGMSINHYIDSPALENISVDISKGLTAKQSQDLSEWTATLLNGFRKELGIDSKVLVTVGSAKVSQEVAEGYNNAGFESGHDYNVLNDMQKRYGFPDSLDEDLAGAYKVSNLNDVYKAVYNGLMKCLFDDAHNMGKVPFGHLTDLSGYAWSKGAFWHDDDPNGNLPEYLGVSIDKDGWVHYNLINEYEVRDSGTSYDSSFNPYKSPEKMDMTLIQRPNINNNNQKEKALLSTLQSQVSQLQSKVSADKQVVSDLTNKVNADKAQLQKDTPAGLQEQLQNDQAKLANDQATLKQQQAKLVKDEAQLKANQDKLNSITPAEVAQAQQQLAEAQTNYNDAVKALNDAQSKANASNDEVAKAQQNYINALNKLNELKQVLENDEKEITTTSVKWVKNEHPVTTSSMGNQVVLSSSKNTPEAPQKASTSATTSSSNNLTTTVTPAKSSSVEENNTVHADTVKAVKASQGSKAEAENTIHFRSEAPQSSVKKEANKNALPQMGDENSNATVWGEISLAMAGVLVTLGLASKKRRN